MFPHMTKILVLLIVANMSFAVAPGWIKKGVELEYSVGGDTYSYKVLGRTSDNIVVEITNNDKTRTVNQNASALLGEFWFDSAELKNTSKYRYIDDFEVIDISSKNVGGGTYDTITLKAELSGAITNRIYERETGLLLKQTVSVPGAPVVELENRYIPGIDTEPEAPEPSAPEPTKTNPEPVVDEEEPEVVEPVEETDVIPEPEPYMPSIRNEPEAEPVPQEPEEKKCCLSALGLVALAGFVLIRK